MAMAISLPMKFLVVLLLVNSAATAAHGGAAPSLAHSSTHFQPATPAYPPALLSTLRFQHFYATNIYDASSLVNCLQVFVSRMRSLQLLFSAMPQSRVITRATGYRVALRVKNFKVSDLTIFARRMTSLSLPLPSLSAPPHSRFFITRLINSNITGAVSDDSSNYKQNSGEGSSTQGTRHGQGGSGESGSAGPDDGNGDADESNAGNDVVISAGGSGGDDPDQGDGEGRKPAEEMVEEEDDEDEKEEGEEEYEGIEAREVVDHGNVVDQPEVPIVPGEVDQGNVDQPEVPIIPGEVEQGNVDQPEVPIEEVQAGVPRAAEQRGLPHDLFMTILRRLPFRARVRFAHLNRAVTEELERIGINRRGMIASVVSRNMMPGESAVDVIMRLFPDDVDLELDGDFEGADQLGELVIKITRACKTLARELNLRTDQIMAMPKEQFDLRFMQ